MPPTSSTWSALARLAWLRRRRLALTLGCGLTLGLLAAQACREPEPLRVVTYNIENFPKSELQIEHAFRTLAGLDAPVVAVQEILDRGALERAVAAELGPRWKVATSTDSRAVGLIYDSERVRLRGTTEHEMSGRKVLEARLERDGGVDLRVFVVHLKSGGPEHVETRRKQIAALTPIVRKAVASSRDEIIVLGDFNVTQEADRQNLRRFAEQTGLRWASESLECTAYWRRRSENGTVLGDCPGSALDHVFTRSAPKQIAAKGLCEAVGCDGGLLCPLGRELVSDHCPVLTEF